jgi:hypothetical protein
MMPLHGFSFSSRGVVRRGAALLIVLAALMITLTATTILVSAAADAHLRRRLADAERLAGDLLDAADGPLQHWLAQESSKVALLPDAAEPAVSVLHDRWMIGSERFGNQTEVELTITAFDQCGMVPMQLARSGSPLRLSLLVDVLARLDAAELPAVSDPVALGLDLFPPAWTNEQGAVVAVFPAALLVPPRLFGDAPSRDDDLTASNPQPPHLAIGASVATHNHDPVRINVNTAPMPLVEAAMRLAGRGGIEQVIAARTKRESAAITGTQAVQRSTTGNRESGVEIVTRSDCWAFRIDVHVGNLLRRSWWAIYAPGPDDPSTSRRETWRCVQRLPITE